ICVTGYAFRVTGSKMFFLLNPRVVNSNGFRVSRLPVPPHSTKEAKIQILLTSYISICYVVAAGVLLLFR
ncbi:MAG: hypothetical protein KAQ81_11385, partial [Deltaproteobacteria bacterium]|nr:hypothetical protein [Deltaproteobacteria bacterium]